MSMSMPALTVALAFLNSGGHGLREQTRSGKMQHIPCTRRQAPKKINTARKLRPRDQPSASNRQLGTELTLAALRSLVRALLVFKHKQAFIPTGAGSHLPEWSPAFAASCTAGLDSQIGFRRRKPLSSSTCLAVARPTLSHLLRCPRRCALVVGAFDETDPSEKDNADTADAFSKFEEACQGLLNGALKFPSLPSNPWSSAADEALPSIPFDQYRNDAAFHQIDLSYPGLRLVNAQPYIFLVPNFVSHAEADALAATLDSADSKPSSERLKLLGERTSVSALVNNDHVLEIQARTAKLARVKISQMQPLKLTRYDSGGQFMQHTDCSVWLNGTSLSERLAHPERFPDRFCTVLIYLNDCLSGGRTCWRWLDAEPAFYPYVGSQRAGLPMPWMQRRKELCIEPRRGTAVIHFPCSAPTASVPLLMDPNAQHESEVVVDTKYVCQQFIWSADMRSQVVDEGLRQRFIELQQQQLADPPPPKST